MTVCLCPLTCSVSTFSNYIIVFSVLFASLSTWLLWFRCSWDDEDVTHWFFLFFFAGRGCQFVVGLWGLFVHFWLASCCFCWTFPGCGFCLSWSLSNEHSWNIALCLHKDLKEGVRKKKKLVWVRLKQKKNMVNHPCPSSCIAPLYQALFYNCTNPTDLTSLISPST